MSQGPAAGSARFVLRPAATMRRWLSLIALGGMACGGICPAQQALTPADGGQARCVAAADCPRPASTLLCASAEDRLMGCVDCVETRCFEYAPETCR